MEITTEQIQELIHNQVSYQIDEIFQQSLLKRQRDTHANVTDSNFSYAVVENGLRLFFLSQTEDAVMTYIANEKHLLQARSIIQSQPDLMSGVTFLVDRIYNDSRDVTFIESYQFYNDVDQNYRMETTFEQLFSDVLPQED